MASQPPAGYNPEASLLQGGTATIQPVQGGGGMEAGAAPSGYNPEASLLNTGHNAPILAVRGGSIGPTHPTEQEGGKGGEAYKDYVIEQYEVTTDKNRDTPRLALPPTLWAQAKTYSSLCESQLKQLKTFKSPPDKEYYYSNIQVPNYSSCQGNLRVGFFQSIRKRYVIIDEVNPIICVISDFNKQVKIKEEKVSTFLEYMDFIFQQHQPKNSNDAIKSTSQDDILNVQKDKKDKVFIRKLPKNVYVLFTGSFFSDDNSVNDVLYYEFLKLKLLNMNNLYYINELSQKFVNTTCHLTERFSQKTSKSTYLIPFFEPDIILFKKQHILFQNSRPTEERNNPSVKLSEVLKEMDKSPEKKMLYESFILSPGNKFDIFIPNESTKVDQVKYVTFNYNEAADDMVLPEKTDILCPKDKSCNGFKGGYKLNTLDDNTKLPPGFYVISKNTDKMPLLKEEGATLTQAELNYLEGKEPEKVKEEEPVKKVRFANEEEAVEEEEEEEHDEVVTPLEGAFKGDPAAVKEEEIEIELNAKIYRIRAPFLEGVTDNWLAGIFTKEEARLLNALQFSPQLLASVFGDKWLSELSNFLTSLLSSECFKDFTLLTSAECSNAEEFVKKVYFGLFTQTLNELYDEFGVPKPMKLAQALELLKKLGTFEEKEKKEEEEKKPFDKYKFTGDLLNRFHLIQYNPKTSQYYTDFADIDEALRKLLDELEFKRVESANYDEIKEAILKGYTQPKPSILPTQEQCFVVKNFITQTLEKKFLESTIQSFLNTDKAKAQNLTMDIFKECVAAVNAELGLDYYTIIQVYSGKTTPQVEYEIKDVKGDGWCFYHALLQSVDQGPDYQLRTYESIQTSTSDDAKVTAFLSKIKAAIQQSPQKANWEKFYNIVNGKGKYNTYLQDLNDPTKKVWADPDFGIGQEAANELKANIEIYRLLNNKYSLITTYKPTVETTKTIRLHYVNNNHYQILLKKSSSNSTQPPPTQPPPTQQPPPPPSPAQKRYAQYTLPGPDPTDDDCEALAAFLKQPSKQKFFVDGKVNKVVGKKINEVNAYNLREWNRDRAVHPDYSIYFMAKCWDKRPDLFPPNEYGFDAFLMRQGVGFQRDETREWVEPYFNKPRSGNPTPDEIKRIEGELNRRKIQDPQNLQEIDLATISNLSYDFSNPFIKKALENSSTYRLEPKFAATIPDFDPITSQGGGFQEEVFDLGDPVQEGGEVFDLGDPVSTKARKNRTRKHRSK